MDRWRTRGGSPHRTAASRAPSAGRRRRHPPETRHRAPPTRRAPSERLAGRWLRRPWVPRSLRACLKHLSGRSRAGHRILRRDRIRGACATGSRAAADVGPALDLDQATTVGIDRNGSLLPRPGCGMWWTSAHRSFSEMLFQPGMASRPSEIFQKSSPSVWAWTALSPSGLGRGFHGGGGLAVSPCPLCRDKSRSSPGTAAPPA